MSLAHACGYEEDASSVLLRDHHIACGMGGGPCKYNVFHQTASYAYFPRDK